MNIRKKKLMKKKRFYKNEVFERLLGNRTSSNPTKQILKHKINIRGHSIYSEYLLQKCHMEARKHVR